jgi:hypothetical protein
MRSKHLPFIIALFWLAALGVMVVLPAFRSAGAYSGPGISGNLRRIQIAKDEWLAAGNTNEWPTASDLFRATPGKTINEIMRPRFGEIYFINRTGAPPFAYLPKTAGGYREGEIMVLSSNGTVVVHQ